MHNYLTVRIFIGLLAYAICQAGGFAQAAVNQPPVIELPPDELPDRPGYQLTTLQALGNRITITDPDAGGSDSIKVTLEAVNDTGTLEVNAAKLTDTGNISGNNSATVTFVDEMANINTVLDGMIFSPKPGFSGVAGIQVTADDQGHTGDGGPQSTSDKLDIIVEGTNVEPKINPPIGDKTVLLDADLTFTVTASDPNANTLVYALLDAAATPVTIAESNNGEFFWTPTETGTFQLFVQVTEIDGYPKNLSVQETITVTVMPPGSLAFTPPIGNQFASIDQPLAFTAQAAGVAGRTLQYSLANDPPPPAGAAIDLNTGEFFWIPTEAGTFPVTVIVTETDVSNNTRIAVETVNISVNGPPVLAVNKIVTRLDTLSFVPAAEIQDPNGNTVTLELLNPPAGASLDANGMFSWTPDTADVYSIDVKITETNGKPSNLENMGTISVAVVPINYRLTVNKSGHGTVSSSLQKINCGIVCNEIFPEEITADLRAEADPYWEFVTWGDACADAGKTQTALVPVVSAALSCTATFDLRIPQTADELRGTPLDVLGIFEARHVVQIAPAVIAELSTEQIAVLSYGAMGGLAVEQTAAIIDTVWGGLTRVNMGGFSPAAIFQFTSDDLNAFDKNEFKQMPPWDIAKFFVNLDCSKVSPLFIADFVPAGWFFDPETMVLIPPANSELMLAPLPPPEDLAENVELPEMPDLNIVFGLGNCAQGRTIVDDMNDTLMRLDYEEFTFVQQEEGILLVTGSGAYENINLAFMADADNISIEGGDAPPGAFVTPEGKIVFITPNGFRVPIIPAPKSMAVLAEAAGSDSNVKLGEEGDVLLMYRENTPLRQASFIQEVVVFDPFLESPPEGICGDIDCGTGVYIDPKPANQSGVIYPDGVFQQIMPAVVSPGAFTKTVRRAVPADNIASNVNGSFGMSYQGKAPHLTPKFGSHARSLAPKERIEPAVAIQADGAALQYTHQSGNQAITTPVSISPPIQPRVHNPQAFIDKVMEFEVVDNVTLNADGSFDVFYGGQTVQKYMIAPTFEIQSIPLSAPIEPSLGVDTEGKVVYTLQVQGNAVAAKLTASLITADVPSLDVFLAMVRGFPGVEITQNADSSFTVLLLPDLYFLVTPTFEFQIKDIIPGEILPAIVGHPDGSVTYTVQQQGTQQAITTKLLVRPIDAP